MAAPLPDHRDEITRQFHTCWYCKRDRGSAAAATACEIRHERAALAERRRIARDGNETLESRPSGG